MRSILAVLSLVASLFTTSQAVAASSATTLLCDHNQHALVHNSKGQAFYVRNPYWHAAPRSQTCIHLDGSARWHIKHQAVSDGTGHVVGFPSIMTGCIWALCTPHTTLPVQVRNLKYLRSTWHVRHRFNRSNWIGNAAYDIWFGKHKFNRHSYATRDGAELMIWLNWRHMGKHTKDSPIVKVAGRRWYLWTWRTGHPVSGKMVYWNYISFRAVHKVWRVDQLDVKALVRYCEHHRHLIRPLWYLESVGAGFEQVRDGAGLGAKEFRVTYGRKR